MRQISPLQFIILSILNNLYIYQEQFLGHLVFLQLGTCFLSMNQQHHIQIDTVGEETLFVLVHMVLVHILVVVEHMVLVYRLVEEGLPSFLS